VRRLLAALAWPVIATMAFPAPGSAQGMTAALTAFLHDTIGLTPDEMRAVTTGTPVVRTLHPPDHHEIVVIGVVRINVPRGFYVRRVADFRSSLRNPTRLAFALFSDPAVAADVAAYSLPHADVEELARCDSGKCKVKLSTRAIVQLKASIDPKSPRADSIATAYFRSYMVRYINAYRQRGNAALIIYDDQPSATAAAQVYDAMLSRSPFMYQYAPSLERYLKNYPRNRPLQLREVLFWSEDDLPGLKPTLSMTHAIVYAPPEFPGSTLIVSKQLYADHYLDGALDVTAVVDRARGQPADTAGIDLVLLRRWHFDDLPSGGLLNVRGRVTDKLRDQTMAFLRGAKTSNEEAYAARGAASR